MTSSDDVVLEFLAEHGLSLPPLAVAQNIELSYSTVKRRVDRLAEAGLLIRHEDPRGYVEISERGRRYLRGEEWDK
jgi:DNA-binding MarR family transcriptional regulator